MIQKIAIGAGVLGAVLFGGMAAESAICRFRSNGWLTVGQKKLQDLDPEALGGVLSAGMNAAANAAGNIVNGFFEGEDDDDDIDNI